MTDQTVKSIAAYLYLHLGEQMPSEDCSEEEFEEWARPREETLINISTVERFYSDLLILMFDLSMENDPENYMVHFYDAAKRTFDGDKTMIRTWFSWLYLIVFQRTEGPRWGDFVQILGVEGFDALVDSRLENLI